MPFGSYDPEEQLPTSVSNGFDDSTVDSDFRRAEPLYDDEREEEIAAFAPADIWQPPVCD